VSSSTSATAVGTIASNRAGPVAPAASSCSVGASTRIAAITITTVMTNFARTQR